MVWQCFESEQFLKFPQRSIGPCQIQNIQTISLASGHLHSYKKNLGSNSIEYSVKTLPTKTTGQESSQINLFINVRVGITPSFLEILHWRTKFFIWHDAELLRHKLHNLLNGFGPRFSNEHAISNTEQLLRGSRESLIHDKLVKNSSYISSIIGTPVIRNTSH